MKRILLALLIALAAVVTLSAFDGYVDITNDTGYTIYYIYVSHASEDTWGQDMLDSESVLSDGETYRVYLSGKPSSIFDIKVEDEDGDTYTFYDIDVEAQDIVVTLDNLDNSGAGEPAGEVTINGPGGDFSGYVDIVNETEFIMYYLYIRQNTKNWGPDLFGNTYVAPGETFKVNLKNFPDSVFDIRLEDEDGDSYSYLDFDVESFDVYVSLDDLD